MRYCRQGFSLIEVLVSVVLLALISYGMVSIYLSISHGRQIRQSLLDIQQRGEMVLSTLSRYVRQAGDMSCVPQHQRQALLHKSIVGYDAASLPLHYGIKPLVGSDIIVVGECQPLHRVKQYQQYAFYIANTGRTDSHGVSVAALYKKRLGGQAVEVVSGIDRLEFSYGLMTAERGDISQYVGSSSVVDWSRVKTVQVAVDLASGELSKVWHSYITLQNRIR